MRLSTPRSSVPVRRAVRPRTWPCHRRRKVMSESKSPQDPGDESKEEEAASSAVSCVQSEELLRGGRELKIVHGSEVYRLLLTRNNKLILQK